MSKAEAERRRQEAQREALFAAWEQGRLAANEGAEPTDNPYHSPTVDPRRCLECGHGYVKCRAIDSKAHPEDRHEWRPDRSRSDR